MSHSLPQLAAARISRDRVYVLSHVVPGASPSPSGWQVDRPPSVTIK